VGLKNQKEKGKCVYSGKKTGQARRPMSVLSAAQLLVIDKMEEGGGWLALIGTTKLCL